MTAGDLLFEMPPPPRRESIATLRARIDDAQAAAVAALRAVDDETGEDNGADDLAACFLAAPDVQDRLLVYLRGYWSRAEQDDDDDEYNDGDGPLSDSERAMMRVMERAHDALNVLRMAIAALRAREITELHDAGAGVTLPRPNRPRP